MTSKNPVALITGGTSGIGLGIAQRLVKDNYQVVIMGRNPERLQAALETLNSDSSTIPALGITGDVSQLSDIKHVLAEIRNRYQRLDALVNNAGLLEFVELGGDLEKAARIFDDVVGSSLRGAFLLSHGCLDLMPSSGGRIINVGSIVAHTGGGPGYTAYAATKAGMHGLTLALASELGPRGITVNTIAPGYIAATGMSSEVSDERSAMMSAQIPMRRPGYPDDVAGAVCWLLSKDASYITGTTIPVNGGWEFYM